MANVSIKRLQISKANSTMVLAAAIAAFMLTFSIIAGRALLSKRTYQNKVIGGKEKAVNQLQANIKAADALEISYKAFIGTSANLLGGNPTGTGDRDGDNAKIVLDALPSQYDFPALASSLEKILTDNNYKITSITGTDDQLAQQNNTSSATPQPVPMPFDLAVSSNISGAKSLLALMESSIRPIKVKTLTLSGSNGKLDIAVNAETYYQPQKSLNIQTKVVQ